MASTRTDDAGSGTMPPGIDTPPVNPLLPPLAGNALAAKPVEATATNAPPQAATPQVAPALISLATRTDGSSEMTVSLNPRDLGQVEVHLVRGHDGTTTVSITASNPETLQELSQNVHHLHAALDMANIPSDGRTMNFGTASVAASGQGESGFSDRGASTRNDGSGASGGQDPGQGRTWQHNRQGDHAGNTADDSGTYGSIASVASRKTWQLSGLNITA